VQDALLDAMRFWLERGVNGFRLDALNHAMHDPMLRDNPPAPNDGKPRTRPFDYQIRLYSQSHPDMLGFVERIRALTDRYGAIFTMAEVGGNRAEEEMKAYTEGEKRLNSAYGFDFLYAGALTPALVAETVARWPDKPVMGWPSWAFENHDAPRALSRWCAMEDRAAFAHLKMALLVALRGNAILYQGEELGITQVDIPFERLQDPEAIANWPLTLSRDGARTPLPWEASASEAGFSTATPWLPLGEENLARSVDAQEEDPGSLLNFTRAMLALRKENGALRHGGMELLLADEDRLVFRRDADGNALLCMFNLSAKAAVWPKEFAPKGEIVAAVNGASIGTLPAYGALIIRE
jgi:alpha-glucosidase